MFKMILADLIPECPKHLANNAVEDLIQDSRAVRSGTVFFAIEGASRDGHDFIEVALKDGAVAAVVRGDHPRTIELKKDGGYTTRLIEVANPRRTLGEAACRLHQHPSRGLVVCGVTGTNGKTTSTYLLEALLKEWGTNPAVIGTIENRLGDYVIPSSHTTPDALTLQALLHDFLARGARAVAMEVTSHAIDQERTAGMQFGALLFTNLTQDHLDYHHTMESYFAVKSRLFLEYPARVRAIHKDDPFGARLVEMCTQKNLDVITFGRSDCDVNYGELKLSASGIEGTLQIGDSKSLVIRSPLIGTFNAQNIAGVTAVAVGLGIPLDAVVSALAKGRVPGRMESVSNSRGVTVVVDYAHTPDALEKALLTLRQLSPKRLVCVFGCGGDRDVGKRPLMGAIAEGIADEIFVTTDNPRTEDPSKIISDIKRGFKNPDKAHLIADRRQAIAEAIKGLHPLDTLLIAGKGHECYQILGSTKVPFDDRLVAQENL